MTKLAIIGTGTFARQHAEALQSIGLKITACYGTNPEKKPPHSPVTSNANPTQTH